MEMDYYAYEYSVIKRLMDIFKIESVECNTNIEDIRNWVKENGELKNDILSRFTHDNFIEFEFKNGFNFSIERKIIETAFNRQINIENIVRNIKYNIECLWLKEIENDK